MYYDTKWIKNVFLNVNIFENTKKFITIRFLQFLAKLDLFLLISDSNIWFPGLHGLFAFTSITRFIK
jgi:hypothetical protein